MRQEFGNLWIIWADDLDNAVAEFGEFIEGKIQEQLDDYIEGWREKNRDLAHSHKGKARFRPIPLDRDRLQELWEEGYWYWVKGIVRRYYGDATTDGVVIWQKTATYDPEIDRDWSVGDVEYIAVETGIRQGSGSL